MRFAALLIAVACSGVFASEPGQPLDCSDWVFLEPGLSCRTVIQQCDQDSNGYICQNVAGRPADAAGGILTVRMRDLPTPTPCPTAGTINYRIEVSRMRDGTRSVIAVLTPRCGSANTVDNVQMAGANDAQAGFDPTFGRLYLGILPRCDASSGGQCAYTTLDQLIAIEGFTTTFEVLQTYTPQASLGFRVPYMPEGMAAADHFDTYWGSLTHPIDFTQAHPLQCGYPAAQPHVGDYLAVVDTVPTPAPGQGAYYVTAATYQGATRYGRKTAAGQLSGRDPALLPACPEN
jgi:hypothetical protein